MILLFGSVRKLDSLSWGINVPIFKKKMQRTYKSKMATLLEKLSLRGDAMAHYTFNPKRRATVIRLACLLDLDTTEIT
jgi:hypothetical protein